MASLRAIFQRCLLVLLACIPMTFVIAQKNSEAKSEWYVATGNWFKDPTLYVRTIGTGKDTVILLHGGWGGENSTLVPSTHA